MMEDPDGGLSFDFEEVLESKPTNDKLLRIPLTSKDLNLSHPSYLVSAGNKASVRIRSKSSRGIVCRHWLKGLCMKGDSCEYLHQYDKERMPICRNFMRYGECWEEDCDYKHTIEKKECLILHTVLHTFMVSAHMVEQGLWHMTFSEQCLEHLQ